LWDIHLEALKQFQDLLRINYEIIHNNW
jgi:hypothetical protein